MKNNAELFWPFQLRQLAVMLNSGIPTDAALASLGTKLSKPNPKLERARGLVKRGVSLPDAFRRSGVVDEFDYTLLTVADTAGHIADGLNHISERRVSQLQRVASFKASLIFPKALIIIGALAGIFVKFASGSQSLAEACVSAGVGVVWFYLLCYLALFIVRADTRIWMSWFWRFAVVRQRSEWYRTALEYFFFNSLVWQVSAGVPSSLAVKGCSHLLRSPHFQHSAMMASHAMSSGESITQALNGNGLVATDRMRQVLLIADQSGTHERAIRHELKLLRINLVQKASNFFKWMPRVFYVIALVFISKFIMT